MKHWDGRDRDDAASLRLPERDRQRIREMFLDAPKRKTGAGPQIHSLIGLSLALGLLGIMAWALAPNSPVSPDLMK